MSNFNNLGLWDGGIQKSREKSKTKISAAGIESPEANNCIVKMFGSQPGDMKVEREIAEMMVKINDTEESALRTIHARYCIPRALMIDINDLSRHYPDPKDRNAYEYYYKANSPQQFFLMSRRLEIVNGEAKLTILYNMKIAREGEN